MKSKLCWLYLFNAAVLITHEIDSAYWHEWKLFGFPGGGIQVFLTLNLLLVMVLLYGFQALVMGRSSGIIFSWVLVAGGFFAAGIHMYFILKGSEAFRLPASLVLLLAALVLSLAQALALLSARRHDLAAQAR
jgi:Family of unknown function (DUF6713)